MDNVKILEVKQSIFASNDEQAAQMRQSLKEKKIFLLNLMSAPGSGKTTTLRSTIAALKDELMWTPKPLPLPGQKPSSCTPAACATWMPR